MHSDGLGVLQLNDAPETNKLDWLQNYFSYKHIFINYFVALGARQYERAEMIVAKKQEMILTQAEVEHARQLSELHQALEEQDGLIASLNNSLNKITSSRSWRLTNPMRFFWHQLIQFLDLSRVVYRHMKKRSIQELMNKLITVWRNEGWTGIRMRFSNSPSGIYIDGGNISGEIKLFYAMQDLTFPEKLSKAEKLFVVIIPEHNNMSGGIYSMFSIAKVVRHLHGQHDYDVVLMTRPNPSGWTYCRQRHFSNTEDVFRFDQIERCVKAKEIYLHIPEYASPSFVENLSPSVLKYLKSLELLDVNILNQNTKLMPEKDAFRSLRELATNLTQSVAHHAYFAQAFADRYDIPTLLLPAYTDLSEYNAKEFEDKDKLIIYSLDESPHKKEVLERIKKEFSDYEVFEIRDISFDHFMDLATRCQFSISFGEGFDGYVAQPIYQGGIGFTVYNEEFFPCREFLKYENFFESETAMIENIVAVMKSLLADPAKYKKLNADLVVEYDKLYSFEGYVGQIKKLINKEFELFPEYFH